MTTEKFFSKMFVDSVKFFSIKTNFLLKVFRTKRTRN